MFHKMDPYHEEIIELNLDSWGRSAVTDAFQILRMMNEGCPASNDEEPEPTGYLVPPETQNEYDAAFERAKNHIIEKIDQFLGFEPTDSLLWVAEGAESDAAESNVWNHIPGSRCTSRHKQKGKEKPMSDFNQYTVANAQNKFLDSDRAIAGAIGKAMRHAERVSKREHIMADRVERVNQFIVSLRRELGYLTTTASINVSDVSNTLTRKEVWYDIGVLNLSFGSAYSLKFSRDQIQRWLDEAQKMRNSTDAARYEIEGDLEELERGLTGALVAVEDAKKINQESEVVASQLCVLFQ
jgi:hypothetical protein